MYSFFGLLLYRVFFPLKNETTAIANIIININILYSIHMIIYHSNFQKKLGNYSVLIVYYNESFAPRMWRKLNILSLKNPGTYILQSYNYPFPIPWE